MTTTFEQWLNDFPEPAARTELHQLTAQKHTIDQQIARIHEALKLNDTYTTNNTHHTPTHT